MPPAVGLGSAAAAVESNAPESMGPEETALASAATSGAPSEPAAVANDGSSAGGPSPSTSVTCLAAMSQEGESQLDDLIWLQILRGLGEDAPLVHARVSWGGLERMRWVLVVLLCRSLSPARHCSEKLDM